MPSGALSSPFQDPSVAAAATSKTTISGPQTMDLSSTSTPMTAPAPPKYPCATPIAPSDPNLIEEMGNSIKATKSSTIMKTMRILNIALGLFTVAVGILAWVMTLATKFDEIIASIYIVLFGTMLIVFELRNERMDQAFQQYFGFMYGYKTRTIFLIFMAIWPLSMGGHWLAILDAIFLFCNAFFNYYVIYNHPAFASTPPAYNPPAPYPNQV